MTSRLEQQLDVASALVLIAVLVGSTLVFGGVLSWTWTAALCAIMATVLARAALATRRGELELPPTWVTGTLVLVWCWVALQAVNLPPWISGPPSGLPEDLAARLGSAFSPGEWRPIALDLGGALSALQHGTLYALTFGLAWSLGRAGYARWFLYALVVLGCFEAFYGLLEQVSQNAEIFGYAKPTGHQRASGTYVNPNHYAAFMGMALPAGIGVALQSVKQQRVEGFWLRLRVGMTRPDAPKRAMLIGAGFLIAVGLVASLSRGGCFAALLGVAALAGIGAQRNRKRSLLVLALAAGLGLWIALLGAERLQARFAELEHLEQRGTNRLDLIRDTADMLKDFPLRGVGAGSYEAVFHAYESADDGIITDFAHCDVLQVVVELGGPIGVSLLVFVVVLFLALGRGVRQEEGPRASEGATLLACACPMLLHSFFDFNLHIEANALWWVSLLGLSLGCLTPASVRAVQLPRRRPLLYALLGGVALSGLTVCWSAVRAAEADWHSQPFVERAGGDKRPPRVKAISHAEAIRIWPFVARFHYRLALYSWYGELDEQLRLADEAARTALDPEVALETEIEALRDQVFAQRIGSAPVLSARSWIRFQTAQGRQFSPADPKIAEFHDEMGSE